mmetsp:Transcript_38770/g.109925  ORF Transcript_38770/g.109925 Transcript_38770/m.109925 type:complete len:216 (+) Transcript_38770:376-1023(+)
MLACSPTMPYFMRDLKPMLPTSIGPVCTPQRILTCGSSLVADHSLSLSRAWSIRTVDFTACVAWSGSLMGVPQTARIASPMNSMTMPPLSSITFDMSLKYLLNNNNDFSGGKVSTMVVKDAMSEKKTVTSSSRTPAMASSPACNKILTTGHGTYLPQDLIAFFILSKMRWIKSISATTWRVWTSWLSSQPASCRCTIMRISSARFLKGFSRLVER